MTVRKKSRAGTTLNVSMSERGGHRQRRIVNGVVSTETEC
jgi:hypothetical protein